MSSRYRLTRRLASGGMAEVFVGISQGDEGFEKPVAVKRMLPHLLADEGMQRMFLAEAKLACFLHHQNIVTVFDVGRGDDGVFLVMELVDGWDLRTLRLRALELGRPFPPQLAAWLVSQVNAGLRHAYGKQVEGKPLLTAHRDVADSNVLVSREGEVKVADFGIARVELFGSHTEPGTFKGRLSYAAPELLSGGKPSWASDQFSLGVLFHELLTGAHPWGEPANFAEYISRVRSTPPDLSRAPPALQEVLRRMLATAPENRLPPEALSAQLGAYLASAGAAAGADELASFVRGLSPPPTPLELPVDPSLQRSAAPASGTWLELEAAEPWEPPPGPALDESGRLDRFGAIGGATRSPAPAPVATPTPEPPREDPATTQTTQKPFTQDDAPLELARDLRRDAPPEAMQPVYPPTPPRSKGGAGVIVAIIVVALVAGAVWYLWPTLHRRVAAQLPGLVPAPRIHVLSIDSEPSGATVLVNGRELGQTPILMENDYPPGDVQVELRLRGHAPWRGTFAGGEEAKLNVTLKPGRGR